MLLCLLAVVTNPEYSAHPRQVFSNQKFSGKTDTTKRIEVQGYRLYNTNVGYTFRIPQRFVFGC